MYLIIIKTQIIIYKIQGHKIGLVAWFWTMRFHSDMRLCVLDIRISAYIFQIRIIYMWFHADMWFFSLAHADV